MNINNFLNFLNDSKTPFQNVLLTKELLDKNNFVELKENEEWNLNLNNNYYVIRNDSSIIAFKLGNNVNKFNIIASHNDSPSFKLKNTFDLNSVYSRLDTEVYGGPILSSWFDRPLGIGGRVFVKTKTGLEKRIVAFDDVCCIPNLAIHLSRGQAQDQINLANDTYPIVSSDDSNFKDFLYKELKLTKEDQIVSHDLFLYNSEVAKVVGVNKDLLMASRIDNIECSYTSLDALLNSNPDNACNMYCCFNNEEVGSGSNNGAESTFLLDTMNRIIEVLKLNKYIVTANSFLVSADNAHACHPAHMNKTDSLNKVVLNKGFAIKSSASLTYTTDGASKAFFASMLIDNNIPYQDFANASDVRGGSTLGRILLDKVSIPSIDVGCGQLAMHSVYETAGLKDAEYINQAFINFYKR